MTTGKPKNKRGNENATKKKGKMGMLVKDEEGNIYFFKQHILDACKVKKEDIEGTMGIRISGDFDTSKLPVGIVGRVADHGGPGTEMCPW
jgi:hypothetical protein